MSKPDGGPVYWRPIVTAPQDKYVILWSDEGVDIGRYDDLWLDGAWLRPETAEFDNDGAVIPNPTHWMPLPEPPMIAHEAGESE